MPSKDDAAQALADAHFNLDHGVTRVFRVFGGDEADDRKPIRLLEVNPLTAEAGVMPIALTADPARGVLYPSVVIELTPDEFARLVRGELKLPPGWALGPELFQTVEAAA